MPLPNPLPTCPVLGVPLAIADYAGAVAEVKKQAAVGQPYLVCAANTHVVALGRHDPDFREVLKAFDLILPDGMPLIWAMNLELAEPLRDRVYGPTFMLRCLEETQGKGWLHLLIGGSDSLLSSLNEKLTARFPDLQIAGRYAPPFGEWPEGTDEHIIDLIRDSGARFIWVGLGCPKQENWLARNKSRLPAGVYVGVGAAFAFHAGLVRQAPAWMQRCGLEWFFRLLTEPRRLWRRYAAYNSLFVSYWLAEKLQRRPGTRS